MKKIYFLLAILCVTNAYATRYVPFVNENAEWQILYTTYPYEFQMAKSTINQIYTLHGDTLIDNKAYKKICLKTNANGRVVYTYFGAIREQDKRVYYIGNGYHTSAPAYNTSAARIKAVQDCLTSVTNNEEVILYDFNSKKGDYVTWGYMYRQIISEDSVLVGNSYRRRLQLSDGDKVVEGIGSIIQGTLSSVSPILLCGKDYTSWQFTAFITNGVTVYKSANNASSGYQTLYSQRTAYYNDAETNITETLKVDSCAFINDSIMYPARTVQLVGDECYDPCGAGWAGKKVVFSNGWNYFFNDKNDTIKIKTDAVLNESWTLFQRTDIKISATVTKWDTTLVLGVADSVKTITLHVFDGAMNPIAHELENATIKISKSYGLVKALNFTYFPALTFRPGYYVTKNLNLVGITNPELGAQKLKWFDVHDFQVGDEFHYIDSENYFPGGSSSEKKYIIRILARENFTDSIRYTQDVRSVRMYKPNAQSDFIITSEQFQNTNLIRKNAGFDQEPGIPVFNRDSTRLQIYPALNTTADPEYFMKSDGCWRRIFLTGDACDQESYAKGRGLVLSNRGCWQSYARIEQVYYKKGAVTWGTPLILTANEELNASVAITVYPNPAIDKIFVDLNDVTHCTFELFDAQGRIILQQELSVQKNHVGVQQLGKGMYLYRLNVGGRQVKAGRIIKE